MLPKWWKKEEINKKKKLATMKKFHKKIEDFVCENCRYKVKGNGYTNHCPECFYSKHVDVNPGDRAANCGGIMKPISYGKEGREEYLIHQCLKCHTKKKNKLSPGDNYENLVEIVKRLT